jgi:hypothetical protein
MSVNEAHAMVVAMHEAITKNMPQLNGTIYGLVARHGREYQGRRKPRDFPYGPQKQCFRNAYDLVEFEHDWEADEEGWPDDDIGAALTYVEGFVVTEIGMPIHHAWAITDDQQVVDTTLRYDGRLGKTRRDPTAWSYFGIPLRLRFVQQVTDRRGYYGVLDGLKVLPDDAIMTKCRTGATK